MSIFLKALIALIVGVVVAFFAGKICVHFGIDPFYGWIAGLIAGMIYYLRGPGI